MVRLSIADGLRDAPMSGEVVTDVETMRRIAVEVIEAAGTPHDLALVVGHSLVESNLMGHDSHGVMRLQRYVAAVRAGQVAPHARPVFTSRAGGAGHVDGNWGWGQSAAKLASRRAVELADRHAIAAVTIDRCNHVGRLGEHAADIAAAGMIGVVLCNAEPVVAPHGGRGRLLGTNPIAFACPRGNGPPAVFDAATAAIAEGKLSVAQARGQQVPPGLVVDINGVQSTDPNAFYEGGALLPFGAHKGYGLSFFVEVLGGILSGAGAACSDKYERGNGTLVMAINAATFMPVSAFETEVGDLCARLIGSSPELAGEPVVVPGDPEARAREHRLEHGIALPAQTWHELVALALELGVDPAIGDGAHEARQ